MATNTFGASIFYSMQGFCISQQMKQLSETESEALNNVETVI